MNNFIKGEWKMSNLVVKKYDCQKCVKDNGCVYKKCHDKFKSNVEGHEYGKTIIFKISCPFYKEVIS